MMIDLCAATCILCIKGKAIIQQAKLREELNELKRQLELGSGGGSKSIQLRPLQRENERLLQVGVFAIVEVIVVIIVVALE